MTRALFALILAITPACAANGAGGGNACTAEPGRAVTAFLDGEHRGRPVVTLSGVTVALPPEPGSVPRYTVTDAGGALHRLAFDDASGPLPVEAGKAYDLTVDYVMGFPSPCGLLLTDTDGLVLAAASDKETGAAVLKQGIPGFTLRLIPTGCKSRPTEKCYESRVNALLEVEHQGQTIRLHHGESAMLGAYRVTCHIAEQVRYAKGCADAGVFQVSYSIRRTAG